MKRCLSVLMFLLVVLVVCTARAQEPEPSLADVARQSRTDKKADPKFVVSDQSDPQPVQPPDHSPCGEPIPVMQQAYLAALLGQTPPPDDQLATALLSWLDGHTRLETIDPEDLAQAEEPQTEQPARADQELADRIAQALTEEMVQFKASHTDTEVQERVAKLMSAPLPQREGDVLQSAVRDEQQRRQADTGKTPSAADRLQEAANLYAICENKRLMATPGELDELTKAALKARLNAAGFGVNETSPAPPETSTP